VRLLLLPKAFSPGFRENWDLYRHEYWEHENERRAALRAALRASDREKRQRARRSGSGRGWLWWTGWWRGRGAAASAATAGAATAGAATAAVRARAAVDIDRPHGARDRDRGGQQERPRRRRDSQSQSQSPSSRGSMTPPPPTLESDESPRLSGSASASRRVAAVKPSVTTEGAPRTSTSRLARLSERDGDDGAAADVEDGTSLVAARGAEGLGLGLVDASLSSETVGQAKA